MKKPRRSAASRSARARDTELGPDSSAAGEARPRPWAAFWPGAMLALCLLVPFLGKAHAVDDVTFLLEAQQVLRDPLHPAAFDMVADGKRLRLSSALVSGPVTAYLLVPSVLLGGAEWAAHLVPLVLVLLSVWATVNMGLRLGLGIPGARLAGLLLAATPAVIGMATTSMADIPAMAFGVLGMERVLAWRDEGRWRQGIAASLSLALAALSRPQMVLLIAVAAAALWAGRRAHLPGRAWWRAWALLLLAIAVILAVNKLTADPALANGDLVTATLARIRIQRVAAKLAAFATHAVLVLPLALPWVIARWRQLALNPVIVAIVLLAAVFLRSAASPAMPLGMTLLALLGVAVIADVFLDAWRRGDREQVWLGGWLLLALATLAYVHLPAKYLVPSAPAAALLVARLLRRSEGRLRPAIGWAAVAAGAVLGVLIALADSEFTDVGRRAARDLIAPRVRAGERVWYSGSWGSQWYAMQAGAIMLADSAPYPASGDFIIASRHTFGAPLSTISSFTKLDALGGLRVTSRFGRVMSPEDGAGFYSNWYGSLPWTWRNGEIEALTLWRVR